MDAERKQVSVQIIGEYVDMLSALQAAMMEIQGRHRPPSRAEAMEYAIVRTLKALKGDQNEIKS